MKKKTGHKTTWRGIYAPRTAVFVRQDGDVALWRIGRSAMAATAKETLINEFSPKDGLAQLRAAFFANLSTETGDFGRKLLLRE